jgi:hypothetical protein
LSMPTATSLRRKAIEKDTFTYIGVAHKQDLFHMDALSITSRMTLRDMPKPSARRARPT